MSDPKRPKPDDDLVQLVVALEDGELALRLRAARENNAADAGAWKTLADHAYILRAALEGRRKCLVSTQTPPGLGDDHA